MRALRLSLRSARAPAAIESPVQEYDRRRSEQTYDAKERLAGLMIGWAAAHGLAAFFFLGHAASNWRIATWEWWRVLGPFFFFLVSVGFGCVAGVVTVRHLATLPKRWVAAGFLAWAMLVVESTVALWLVRV